MEQGSQCDVHNSNQNNLLALINNFVTQGADFEGNPSPSNIVATANTTEKPIFSQHTLEANSLRAGQVEVQDPVLANVSSCSVDELSIPGTSGLVNSVGKSVSHNNIRKTISDIASNQRSLLPGNVMPQNALLETTIPMTNIAASSANEYMAVRNGLEMPPPVHNNVYPTQTWNTGAINSENNVENTRFTTTQACLPANVNPAAVRDYTSSSLPGTYLPNHIPTNGYQNQPPQFLPQTEHCTSDSNLDQYLQSTQLTMGDYQQGLTQPNFTTSTAQCMTTSSYEKMDAFRQGPMYISSSISATLSQPTTLDQSLSLPYNESLHSDSYYPKVVENGRKVFGDTSSEENITESSTKEKKLTTTPIPSDAEKMSSSSSVTSSSHEESPSPNETDSDPSLRTSRSFDPTGTAHVTYKSQAVAITSSAHCNAGSVDQNASNVIPVPKNAVDVQKNAIDYDMDGMQREKVTIPVSPSNSSDANSSAGNTAFGNVGSNLTTHRKGMHSDKTLPLISDSGSSWSVIKEERRKQKMEQKMEKKMQQDKDQEVGSDRVSVSRDKSVKTDNQAKRQRHKHKHRSKHHHYHMPANVTNLPGENNTSSGLYRGLIPKVTADPTNNLNYTKPTGPPRSITEKVKQQMMKQQGKAMSGSKHNSHLKPPAEKQKPEQLTSPTVAKGTACSHIAPAKFSSSSKESGAIKNTTCRWQTVTAIEGPKMPPMLSESDRIPKRGRPSKKTSAINLKYKAEKAKAETLKAPVEKQNLVAMYTISENGCYEKLESKPKQNQRSKERAEAFRNELLEITKKTTIQKKTAGAKDVIGAFKAVGVRTRHQASNPIDVDDAKKKLKTKGKIFGGETTTSKGSDKIDVIDENAVYTFSELAKQFKISSSIVYRAMEQAQRSSMSKRVSKSSQKHKDKHVENRAPKPKAEQLKPAEESLPARPALTPQISPKLSAISSASSGEYALEKTGFSLDKADSTSPIKPTSLSSEKSTDLVPDVVKRKKKKKKHKKEKNEVGKKKKKDKKKKSKRKEIRNSSDSVFNLEANEVFSVSSATISPERKEKLKESRKSTEEKYKKVSKHSDKKSRKNSSTVSTETVLKKVDSVSSMSGGDDAYDGGDSSSDIETVSPGSQFQPKLSAVSSGSSSLPVTTVATSTSVTATIFGSGISSIMPTFQGIKEHGGLQQYSEHTKNLAEASLFRVKKHKHKKKKPLSRAKNVIDPEFLSKMEKLVEIFGNMKISPIMRFVPSPFGGQQTSNVFAFEPKSLGGQEHKDLSTSRSKRTTESISTSKLDPDSSLNMSVFCRSQFFQDYGYIKPYMQSSESNFMKSSLKGNAVKPAANNFEFSTDSNTLPVFQKSKSTDSNSSNETSQRVQTPDPSNRDLSDDAKVSNRPKRPAKKTRGWPRGKPRKPRPTSSAVNNESKSTVTSPSQSFEANASCNPKEKKDVTLTPILSQHQNTVDEPLLLVQSSPTKASTSKSNTATTSAASVAPINQDLVDHIKAAITASLSAAAVCSEAVAKTVDSAVASYFHNVKGDATAVQTLLATSTSQRKEKLVEKEQPDTLIKKKRNRVGRPNKYLKLIEKVNELNEDDKCSDKHPKKVWASKHQDSSVSLQTEEAKPKKRGPGRPRKYPSLDGSPPAKVSKKSQDKTSSSKMDSTGKGRVALPVQSSKPDKKSKPSKPLKVVVRGKRTGVGNWESSTKNSKLKTRTKALPFNKEKGSDLHLNLIEEPNDVEDAFGTESSDTVFSSACKGTAKKSLESVVAKLKRKQSTSSPISNSEDGDASPTQENFLTGSDENLRNLSASSDDLSVKNNSSQKMKAEKRKGALMANEEPPKKRGIKKSSSINEKKWITAGLFSSTFKRDGFDSVSEDPVNEPLFPAPLHAGLFLRQKQENFKLPHDIWSLHRQKRISTGRNVTDTYMDTNTNIYYDVTPASSPIMQSCACSVVTSDSEGCLENCKNRSEHIECSPDTCRSGESCQPNCEIQKWHSDGQDHLCLFSKQLIRAGDEVTCDYSRYVCELFDQSETCRCGASHCSGNIGLSYTQQPTDAARSVKPTSVATNKKKKSQTADEKEQLLFTTVYENNVQATSAEEEIFIKEYKPFLLRNLMKIKRQHERASEQMLSGNSQSSSALNTGTNAENHRLLYDVIKNVFDRIMTCKDENDVTIAIPLINLRSKQKGLDHKKDPFDLSFVEDKIVSKQYEKFEEFSADLLHVFRNAEKQFGRKSTVGKDVAKLRRVYATARSNALSMLGEPREKSKNKDSKKSECELEDRRRNGDFIRCICGIYEDEGMMIQCEKCFVWQHCDCMRVKASDYSDGEEYLCEECDGREVPREVEVVPQPSSAPGHTYYRTLLKDNLLIRQGDCVRLIHDHCLRHNSSNNPPVRSSYRLQSHSAPERMDFFRIKKLWTDDNGDKFAYGYHFVRPQDAKHTETRLFFTNELLATPFHEIVPLDAVVGLCCVMDLETYRRGKPKGFKEADIYICQHRTDFSLKIVNKVIKNRYPICTKPHVFESYPVRLVTVRNYQVPEQYKKSQPRRTQWLKAIDHQAQSDEDDSSEDEEISEPPSVVVDTVAMDTDEDTSSNERDVKERRLNGIVKKLIKDANTKKGGKDT